LKNINVLISSILAGFCIGIGGTIYLSMDNKILGSLFFAIGLLTICSYGLHLYTGKVCYVFDKDKKYLFQIPIIWFGNLAGTGIIAFLLSFTRYNEKLMIAAQNICNIKSQDNLLSLFILGIFCNIMIYIAVEGYRKIPFELGKYLSLFLGVMVFILCGFEHSVADMFYFWTAQCWSKDILLKLVIITLGNAVGGILFHEAKKLYKK
jgi:formate/nitrite transporter FocA (FNT family)